jgi:hypothetical protein
MEVVSEAETTDLLKDLILHEEMRKTLTEIFERLEAELRTNPPEARDPDVRR